MGMFVVAPAASFNHHHHHHHHQHDSAINLASASDPMNGSNAAAATALGVGVGVIPLLTAAPCLTPQNMDDHQDLSSNGRNRISGIQFWQNQDQYNNNNIKKASTVSILDHNACSANLLQTAANTSSLSGTTTCQDCGNQAKKDCSHRRCRTCCKSRGYDCATHVKSTWVPAARRRERQLMASAAVGGGAGSSGSTSGVKKPRLLINSQTTTTSHTSTSNTTPPRSFDTSSSHQDVSFKEALPGQVRAPAVFKCVRVTAMDDGQDEYAYQAVVKIGGHVFKGFLYDQGVESGEGFPNISELQLGGIGGGDGSGGGGDGGGRNGGGSSSSPLIDPSDVYGASGGGFLGGSAYGNPMN